MFSVIVTTCDPAVHGSASPEAVARTLAALVPGAISGAVRDVVMAGAEMPATAQANGWDSRDLGRIADHAGCEFVVTEKWLDAVRGALRITREPHVFVLRAGFAPESGFYEELSDLAWETHLTPTRLLERPSTILHRALPFLAPLAGIAADRDRLALVNGASFSAWARGVGPKRTMRTRARRVD